jgi:hypothetical protein
MNDLTIWSKGRWSQWTVERTYPARYVTTVLGVPESGTFGRDGRLYQAFPVGIDPNAMVAS